MDFLVVLFTNWSKDKVSTLSAAFAYFTIFSLAPLLVICIAVAGLIYDKSAVQVHILNSLSPVIGSGGSQLVAQMINSQTHSSNSIIAAGIGLVLVIIGAVGFYSQLLEGLNTIWEVQPKALGVWGFIRTRFLGLLSILVMSFFLILAIVSSALLNKYQHHLNDELLVKTAHITFSLGLIALIFSFMYKFVADVHIKFRDVWLGALFAAILFVISQVALGWFFSHTSMKSQYGLASSLIIIIFWLYYLGQIIFLGAEFIKVLVSKTGTKTSLKQSEQSRGIFK